MPGITRPYRRTARPFVGTDYLRGNTLYVTHPGFANDPERYVRAFKLLQDDLKHLFEYVEPADGNSGSYSFRVHEISLRACVEVEANCKAILEENGYMQPRKKPRTKTGKASDDWNMADYKKLEASHRLSAFQVKIWTWYGSHNMRTPFASWASGGSLPWYDAYNATKHDRHVNFAMANFGHTVDAVCGLLALLAAQFITYDFDPTSNPFGRGDEGSKFWPAQGSLFTVRFPENWPDEEHYDLTGWDRTRILPDPFQRYSYP